MPNALLRGALGSFLRGVALQPAALVDVPTGGGCASLPLQEVQGCAS